MTIQRGVSAEADFEKNTWTFEMLDNYRVGAGKYAIISESTYGDILGLLRAIVSELDQGLNCSQTLIRQHAKNAIAKATGEQQ